MKKKDDISLALLMYADEPCRICGRKIKISDLKSIVFAGYSAINPSRAAHKRCWDGMMEIVKEMDAQGVVTAGVTAESADGADVTAGEEPGNETR